MTYVYGIFLDISNYQVAYSYAFLGLGLGFFHGLVTTLVLKILLVEHHPSDEYQTISNSAAMIHVLSHLVYGIVIGTMYGTFMI